MAVDVTVAGASANSYSTVAEADAYVTEVGGSSTWNALSDTEKENYLKRAARIIDRYGYDGLGRYDVSTITAGQRTGQALEFPRVVDVDGAGDPYVPPEVKECANALALALATGAASTSGSTTASVDRLKAGSFEIEFDTSSGSVSSQSTDDIVKDILGHRLVHGVRTV